MTGVQSRHPKSCAEGSWRRGGAAAIACLALGVVFCARPAAAETLVEALSNAYLINPVLNAERANLRATDEQVAVAKSGLRPNISASGDAAFQNQESDIVGGNQSSSVQKCDAATAALEPAFCGFLASQTNVGNIESQLSSDGVTHPRGYSVTLSQTVFQGFQNINAIRQAKATVQAGREGLRATEQTTLLNAATAYVDVVRDQAVVKLRQTNVDVLTEQLRQTKDRFNVGEVTRTDVAQAEARRSELHHPALCRPGQPQDEPRHLRGGDRSSAVEPCASAVHRASAAEPARGRHDLGRRAEPLPPRRRLPGGGVPL